MDAVLEAYAVWNRRVPTAALNRFLAQAVEAQSAAGRSAAGVRGSIT